MNKKQRIFKCLSVLQKAPADCWADVAADNRIALSDLEEKGYIRKKEEKTPAGDPSYEVAEEGKSFMTKNPVYLRPTLKEILCQQVGTIRYLGKRVRIFNDEAGQQYYFYYEGSCVGCGAYNPSYEDFVKGYLDSRLSFICAIDTPEYPAMKATLEYRNSKAGYTVKCLVLSDHEEGLFREPFYVGEKRASNESCIERARYLISIIKRQSRLEKTSGRTTTEESQ